MSDPTEAAFFKWVADVFDHPVTKPSWWWQEETRPSRELGPPDVTIAYLRRLFEEPAFWSDVYSADQIAQGLWFLFDSSCSEHLRPLTDKRIDIVARVGCIGAISRLYEDVFARLCREELGHLDTSEVPHTSLNGACYMLWDIADLLTTPDVPSEGAIDDACLAVMSRALRVSHIACQESALHGLGHWHRAYPKRVAEIVDEFIRSNSGLSPELIAYARQAREGLVL